MPRVFVINKGGHDYGAARSYGELVYCSEGPMAKYDISNMVRVLGDALSTSDEQDYILLSSLSSMCSIACAIFAQKHHRLNLLIFRDGGYVERRVVINGSPTDKESTNGSKTLTIEEDAEEIQRRINLTD